MDILDRIDAAVGCMHCDGPLGDSPSDDFCSQDHQRAWHADRAAELTEYREPWLDHDGPYRLYDDAMTVETFRLPRQTSSLRSDRAALYRAARTATTPAQREACTLRAKQLRLREAQQAARRPRQTWQLVTSAGTYTIDPGRGCGCGIRIEGVTMPQPAPPVDDPRARALAARRNRNTGPPKRRGRPSDFQLCR